ncbi:MAG: ribbon-helix-helix protein, CopG family [Nitrospirae bacterium]|nr:ribbon-helix-helix protein, CopG family [Nitrospirota bacterium]MDA1305195.1 ribbon-helix-helix protein, CopG family [Nitrospirota bacterium]
MGTEAFTVRSESKKVKKLDKLALQRKRSRNYLMNEALDYYLDVQAWQMEQIQEGIKAANDGRFVSDAKMDKLFNKYKDSNS